ncbi:hypothetical protein ACLOJK_035518 [Asimina triloba]
MCVTGLGLSAAADACDFVFLTSVAGSAIVRRPQHHPLPFPFLEPFLFIVPIVTAASAPHLPHLRRRQRPPSPILLNGAVILPPSALPAVSPSPHLPHLRRRQRRRFQRRRSSSSAALSSDLPRRVTAVFLLYSSALHRRSPPGSPSATKLAIRYL